MYVFANPVTFTKYTISFKDNHVIFHILIELESIVRKHFYSIKHQQRLGTYMLNYYHKVVKSHMES